MYSTYFGLKKFFLAFRRHAVRSQELSNSDIGCFALAKFEKWHYSIYDSVTKKCYLLDLDTENPPNTGPGSDIASNFIGKVQQTKIFLLQVKTITKSPENGIAESESNIAVYIKKAVLKL